MWGGRGLECTGGPVEHGATSNPAGGFFFKITEGFQKKKGQSMVYCHTWGWGVSKGSKKAKLFFKTVIFSETIFTLGLECLCYIYSH